MLAQMKKVSRLSARLATVGLFVFLVSGCAQVQPFDYQATADEMKPEGGLLSGPKGDFVIYSR